MKTNLLFLKLILNNMLTPGCNLYSGLRWKRCWLLYRSEVILLGPRWLVLLLRFGQFSRRLWHQVLGWEFSRGLVRWGFWALEVAGNVFAFGYQAGWTIFRAHHEEFWISCLREFLKFEFRYRFDLTLMQAQDHRLHQLLTAHHLRLYLPLGNQE